MIRVTVGIKKSCVGQENTHRMYKQWYNTQQIVTINDNTIPQVGMGDNI